MVILHAYILTKVESAGTEEAVQKSFDFAWDTEKHCLAKFIKIYGDLVTQIREVQPEYLVDQVKGLRGFLAIHKREVEKEAT